MSRKGNRNGQGFALGPPESVIESGCAEHGAAAKGGVEGVQRKGKQQRQPREPDPRIPSGEMERDGETSEYI